jgi:hypothetical protein
MIIKIDASDFILRVILSQKNEEGCLYAIAFYLRQCQLAEINYEIDDKKLLVVVDSLKVSKYYLVGPPYSVIISSDYQNL